MESKSSKETIEYWRRHVAAYKTGGLTREAYSNSNGIRAYQLDYWRKKISRMDKMPEMISPNQWVPVKINDEPTENDSHIDLWIGPVRIEVRKDFDSKLLTELIRTLGAAC